MRLGLGIQVLGEHRRVLHDFLRRRMLAVEDAQRIAFEAALAVVIQLVEVRAEIILEQRPVRLARLRRTQRIDLQLHARESEHLPEARGQRDDFDVDVRTREADGFEVYLVELAEAALLRLLVAEHRALAPELEPRTAQQAVGDRGADDAGGGFRTQREAVAALVGEGVHLLLDHVGVLTDGTLEQLGVLDHGHADFLVAIRVHHGAGSYVPRAATGRCRR